MPTNPNLTQISLGSPTSIEIANQYPNATLTLQSNANLQSLTLHDDGQTKCTQQGALVTAASVIQDIDHPVKVDIQGDASLTSAEVDAFFDILAKYTSDSNIAGHATSEVCYEDAVEALHARFPQFSIEALKYFVRFKDPEVLRVLLANASHAYPDGFTAEEIGTIQKIGNCFDNNESIQYFDELKYTQITKLGYYGHTRLYNCINLKSVDLRNIVDALSEAIYDCKSLEIISLPKCKTFANRGLYFVNYDFATKAIFIPSCTDAQGIERSEMNWNRDTALEHIDVGKNCVSISGTVFYLLGRGKKTSVVFRGDTYCRSKSFLNSLDVMARYIYVQPDLLESYKTRQTFSDLASIIKPIGGAEWIAEFGSADKYANIDKYETRPEMRDLLKQANE